jgi:hypothetical protein
MDDMLQYIDEMVEPAIKLFEEQPTSRLFGFLACVAAFHAVDYLAWPRKRSSQLRKELGKQSADFRIVDQVAHAFKHVVSGNRATPDLRMGDVIPRPPSFCGVMVVGLSRIGDKRGGVTLYNDHSVDLLTTLKRTVAFLGSWEGDGKPLPRTRHPLAASSEQN